MFGKKAVTLITIAVILMSCILTVAAQPPYRSYTYTSVSWDAPSPVPYLPVKTIDQNTLGMEIKEPQDFVYDKDGNIYILASGSNIAGTASVIIIDKDFNIIRTIKSFDNNGVEDNFKKPMGLFVTDKKDLYICDTENKRVVILDKDDKLVRIIKQPDVEIFPENYEFNPKKVAVDKNGGIYLVVRNDYNGIMELTYDGGFIGYLGSNKVTVNPIELFWKSIMSQKQRDQMIQFVPIEYGNIHLEKNGFMFVVSPSETVSQPIRRLNASGRDILVRKGYAGNVTGDKKGKKSIFVDVTVDDWGIYSILDQSRGRIFSYSSEGDLLYVFGNIAGQVGTFKTPVAIDTIDDRLYILDSGHESLTIFEMTEYAKAIRTANREYYEGNYEKSAELWQDVLKVNANFELAYVQIGRVLLRQEKFAEAMEYFELGNYRGNSASRDNGYTKAMSEYRKEYLRSNLGVILSILSILILTLWTFRYIKKRRNKKQYMDESWEGDSA